MRGVVAIASVFLLVGSAGAQGPDPLAGAIEAYDEVDYERALGLAQSALERGGYAASDVARIYQLIGVSAAALGEEGRSRDAYVRLLAVDPDARVDMNLAPQMRSPFMEARGYWSARDDRLEASAIRAAEGVHIRVSDPLSMVATVRFLFRSGNDPFQERRLRSSTDVPVGVELDEDAVYVLQLLDYYGNQLFVVGTESSPQRIGAGNRQRRSGVRSPVLWGVIAGVVVAAAGATTAVLLVRRRDVPIDGEITFGVD